MPFVTNLALVCDLGEISVPARRNWPIATIGSSMPSTKMTAPGICDRQIGPFMSGERSLAKYVAISARIAHTGGGKTVTLVLALGQANDETV